MVQIFSAVREVKVPLPTGVSEEQIEEHEDILWWTVMCSICGQYTDELPEHLTICESMKEAIEKVFTKSKEIKCWDDIWFKCREVFLLKGEKAVLQEDEELIEGDLDGDFAVIKDKLLGGYTLLIRA